MHNPVMITPGLRYSLTSSFNIHGNEKKLLRKPNNTSPNWTGILFDNVWANIGYQMWNAIGYRGSLYNNQDADPLTQIRIVDRLNEATTRTTTSTKKSYDEFVRRFMKGESNGFYHWNTITVPNNSTVAHGYRGSHEDIHYIGTSVCNKDGIAFFRVVAGVDVARYIEESPMYPGNNWRRDEVFIVDDSVYNENEEEYHPSSYYQHQVHRPFGLSLAEIKNKYDIESLEYIVKNQYLYFTFPELFINPLGEGYAEIINKIDPRIMGVIDHIKNEDPLSQDGWMALADLVQDAQDDDPETETKFANFCGFTRHTLSQTLLTVHTLNRKDLRTLTYENRFTAPEGRRITINPETPEY